MRRILAGVVLALLLTGGAAAGPLEDGAAAYQRGNYATALRLWRPLAEQRNGIVQSLLGFMYAKGQGVPQDDTEALKWYRLAAAAQTASGLRRTSPSVIVRAVPEFIWGMSA